jgi:hypothetical protein
VWLEPGGGILALASARRATPDLPPLRRRLGEMLSCEPIAMLENWRRGSDPGTLDLPSAWRGETARLTWTDASRRRDPSAVDA